MTRIMLNQLHHHNYAQWLTGKSDDSFRTFQTVLTFIDFDVKMS
jgi:hypothetical protein